MEQKVKLIDQSLEPKEQELNRIEKRAEPKRQKVNSLARKGTHFQEVEP
jgi:hypothetical protein